MVEASAGRTDRDAQRGIGRPRGCKETHMDFNDTPDEAAFRAETRAFLAANAEPKSRVRPVLRLGDLGADGVQRCKDWQAKKADAGFAGITWPKRFGGREASPILQVIYAQEEDNYAVPRGLFEIGLGMCIPTM